MGLGGSGMDRERKEGREGEEGRREGGRERREVEEGGDRDKTDPYPLELTYGS